LIEEKFFESGTRLNVIVELENELVVVRVLSEMVDWSILVVVVGFDEEALLQIEVSVVVVVVVVELIVLLNIVLKCDVDTGVNIFELLVDCIKILFDKVDNRVLVAEIEVVVK
jgi:hypothetical protein